MEGCSHSDRGPCPREGVADQAVEASGRPDITGTLGLVAARRNLRGLGNR